MAQQKQMAPGTGYLYLSYCLLEHYEQTAVLLCCLLDAAEVELIMEQSVEVVQAYVANTFAFVCL
jgi:hypothetical protein